MRRDADARGTLRVVALRGLRESSTRTFCNFTVDKALLAQILKLPLSPNLRSTASTEENNAGDVKGGAAAPPYQEKQYERRKCINNSSRLGRRGGGHDAHLESDAGDQLARLRRLSRAGIPCGALPLRGSRVAHVARRIVCSTTKQLARSFMALDMSAWTSGQTRSRSFKNPAHGASDGCVADGGEVFSAWVRHGAEQGPTRRRI